jgi:hypothetical protein
MLEQKTSKWVLRIKDLFLLYTKGRLLGFTSLFSFSHHLCAKGLLYSAQQKKQTAA